MTAKEKKELRQQAENVIDKAFMTLCRKANNLEVTEKEPEYDRPWLKFAAGEVYGMAAAYFNIGLLDPKELENVRHAAQAVYNTYKD